MTHAMLPVEVYDITFGVLFKGKEITVINSIEHKNGDTITLEQQHVVPDLYDGSVRSSIVKPRPLSLERETSTAPVWIHCDGLFCLPVNK